MEGSNPASKQRLNGKARTWFAFFRKRRALRHSKIYRVMAAHNMSSRQTVAFSGCQSCGSSVPVQLTRRKPPDSGRSARPPTPPESASHTPSSPDTPAPPRVHLPAPAPPLPSRSRR